MVRLLGSIVKARSAERSSDVYGGIMMWKCVLASFISLSFLTGCQCGHRQPCQVKSGILHVEVTNELTPDSLHVCVFIDGNKRMDRVCHGHGVFEATNSNSCLPMSRMKSKWRRVKQVVLSMFRRHARYGRKSSLDTAITMKSRSPVTCWQIISDRSIRSGQMGCSHFELSVKSV